MRLSTLYWISFVLSAPLASAAPVCILRHTEPDVEAIMRNPLGVPTIESAYFIEREMTKGLPRFDPFTGEGLLPAHEAMEIAFSGHFAQRGVSKSDFYRMATIGLQKVDDYTKSSIAEVLKNESEAIREMWYYVISCSWPSGREVRTPPPPALVLMNGEVVEPRIERKDLLPKQK